MVSISGSYLIKKYTKRKMCIVVWNIQMADKNKNVNYYSSSESNDESQDVDAEDSYDAYDTEEEKEEVPVRLPTLPLL